MEYLFGLFALFAVGVFIYRVWGKAQDDAQAMYWASVKEPFIFISETAFDSGLETRAQEAKDNLIKYGNKFLVSQAGQAEVWVYVYRVHMNILTNVHAIDSTHSIWRDEAIRHAAQRKAAWIAQKSEWVGNNAGRTFGGQQVSSN